VNQAHRQAVRCQKFPMLTVYEDFRSLVAGASSYLLKHIPLGKLVSAIKEAYEGSYIRNTYENLHVHSRTEAVVKFLNR